MTSAHILPDGKVHMFGSYSDIKRLKLNPKAVVVPVDVPFLVVVEAMGVFFTYGPVGGSNLPYQLIEWAWKNTPVFGVSICQQNGMNMPVIWLAKEAEAKRVIAAFGLSARKEKGKL